MHLIDYIRDHQLTFDAFAKLVGEKVSAQAIHRYSHFLSYPRPERAKRIVKVTNDQVTMEDLYGPRRKSK